MDIQYFCERICSYYQDYINESYLKAREELKVLINLYLVMLNDAVLEALSKVDLPDF